MEQQFVYFLFHGKATSFEIDSSRDGQEIDFQDDWKWMEKVDQGTETTLHRKGECWFWEIQVGIHLVPLYQTRIGA